MIYDELINEADTGSILKGKNNRVLKLFYYKFPENLIRKEFKNSLLINNLSFNKPRCHGLLKVRNRTGIVYDFIEGDRLTDLVNLEKKEDPGLIYERYAYYLSSLHKDILKNNCNKLTDYKESLKKEILSSNIHDKQEKKEALDLLESLPNGDSICHGDFHTGNIIISEDKPYCIDFMAMSKGPRLYDIGRTYCMLEHKYGQERIRNKNPNTYKTIIKQREILAKHYLNQMSTSWDEIKDYYYLVKMIQDWVSSNKK